MIQQFFLPSARALDIDGGKYTPIHQGSIEMDFHVTGALEFFKNHFIHSGTSIYQSSGNNGKRATFLNIPGSTEKALRFVKGIGVDTTGKDLSGVRLHGVV